MEYAEYRILSGYNVYPSVFVLKENALQFCAYLNGGDEPEFRVQVRYCSEWEDVV